MRDPLLDEIWRVREELVKQHGGLDGFLRYVQRLEREHQQRQRQQKAKKSAKRKIKSST